MSQQFARLFSEITLGATRVKNRIVSTGHHTYLADKSPGDALIAYHEARARGGVGLIVSEIIAVHASAGFSRQLLGFDSRDAIADYRRLAEACQRHGCRIFAQLFHPDVKSCLPGAVFHRSLTHPRRYPTSDFTSCRKQ